MLSLSVLFMLHTMKNVVNGLNDFDNFFLIDTMEKTDQNIVP